MLSQNGRASSQGCHQKCTARRGVKLAHISGWFFPLSALCMKFVLPFVVQAHDGALGRLDYRSVVDYRGMQTSSVTPGLIPLLQQAPN